MSSVAAKNGTRDLVLVGGSAGSIESLQRLLKSLSPGFPGSLLVVIHTSAEGPGLLPKVLSRASGLPAVHPVDQEPIRAGHIYVAPPDHHLTIGPDNLMRVRKGPRENGSRPAIDPLFRSAASAGYGLRTIGVLLSGYLDDGSAGMYAIRRRGGIGIIQDPNEALAEDMPVRALQYAGADFVLPVTEIGAKLGTPSPFACPECHGVLWEIMEGGAVRYKCRTGHAYSEATLNEELSRAAETALWAAMRTLEEKASMARRMADSASGPQKWKQRLYEEAATYATHAETLRKMILGEPPVPLEAFPGTDEVRESRKITGSDRT